MPGGSLTLLQVVIGVVDLTCCAAAMYMVMPAAPAIDFISLSVIFITATLLGFASHTPGGIGVFDATMLIALEQFDREELVATAFSLYESFRPSVPRGTKGWGAKGMLDLARIRALADRGRAAR